jgi:hypothetical protein
MGKGRKFLDPPGEIVEFSELRTQKGRSLVEFIRLTDGACYVSILSCGRVESPGSDVICLTVQVERPQRVVHPIRREERIAVVFGDDDKSLPEVLALREDFPKVPHTNLRPVELPRSLCLYEQGYDLVKLDWTPARFLFRLRFWLQHTATGTLHGEEQPLEPLLQGSPQRLILPGDSSLEELEKEASLFNIFRSDGGDDEVTLIAKRVTKPDQKPGYVAAVFTCKEQTHGVISFQPQNLEQLSAFCEKAGPNLAEQLAEKIRNWQVNKPAKEILACRLIIILLLPKRRADGSRVETVEQWAFLCLSSVEEVGIALEVIGKGGGQSAYLISAPTPKKERLAPVRIATLQVLQGLSPVLAAAMNGILEEKRSIFAIGMGALGSQIFNTSFVRGLDAGHCLTRTLCFRTTVRAIFWENGRSGTTRRSQWRALRTQS